MDKSYNDNIRPLLDLADSLSGYLKGTDIKIQCSKEEKFEEICQRFANKIGKDKNSYIYLYAGNQLNFELSYEEHLIDKNIKGK